MTSPSVRRIRVPGLPEPLGPYADAVVAGRQVWVSGIVSVNEREEVLFPDDPQGQVAYCLERLRDALARAGSHPRSLVHLTNYVTSSELRSLVHRQRERLLPEATPASTMVVVHGLVLPRLVYEVQAVAVLDSDLTSS